MGVSATGPKRKKELLGWAKAAESPSDLVRVGVNCMRVCGSRSEGKKDIGLRMATCDDALRRGRNDGLGVPWSGFDTDGLGCACALPLKRE